MGVWVGQGIGLLRVKPETCIPAHPSSRSITLYGSPIIPVRTLELTVEFAMPAEPSVD
jgi:hypothetical protein